jgi:two-component system, OmpR family, phosphate regulon sensor histidine kinase PhoR
MSLNQILLYLSFAVIILLISILIPVLIKIRNINHVLLKTNKLLQNGMKYMGNKTAQAYSSKSQTKSSLAVTDNISEFIERFSAVIEHQLRLTDLIIDSIREGILIINSDKEIININENLLNLFYIKKEDVLNKKTVFILKNVKFENLINSTLDKLIPQKKNIIFYGDEEKHLSVEAIPLDIDKQEGGRGNANLLVLFKNITGEIEFSKLRSQFVANISHEMRTPVTSISGYIDTILEDDTIEPHKIRDYLKKSLKETEKLNFLIKDVLNLSNIEYRRNILFEKEYNIVDIIKETIKSLKFLAEKNGIKINLKSSKDIIKYCTDEELFSQMARNIIENSIFYGGRSTEINIDIREKDNNTVLLFKDNGAGIEKEELPYIFQRFYRCKSPQSSKQIGSGLGLSIVKHTVELHGGKISVRSIPGKETVFEVTLPRRGPGY